MLAALDHADDAAVAIILSIIILHCRALDVAVSVLRNCLISLNGDFRHVASRELIVRGKELLHDDALKFESSIQAHPSDLAVRILLIGYYYHHGLLSPLALNRQAEHIHWIINNCPQTEIASTPFCSLRRKPNPAAYEKAKQLWLAQIAKTDCPCEILANAANFFLSEEQQLSEHLLKRAMARQPANVIWHKKLARLHLLGNRFKSPTHRRQSAMRALQQLEDALARTQEQAQADALLTDLARAASDAGASDKARFYATELLSAASKPEFAENAQLASHYGNLILGRLALQTHDVQTAKAHLLRAAVSAGVSGGAPYVPCMNLAQEFLDQGDRDTVVEYLKLCAKHCELPNHQFQQWIYAAEHGLPLDFGPYLAWA
jgi:hypothetical protein